MKVRITAKRDGFCRCGMSHSSEATTHPEGTFTKAQIKELQESPQLVVELLKDDKEATPPTDITALLVAERQKIEDEYNRLLVEERTRLAEESAAALETEKAKLTASLEADKDDKSKQNEADTKEDKAANKGK
ncbi:HI1506-related protein [Limnobaculum xujianqingii]|uniref:HI1506-related protein n=1 Tax=Limnobaculum xujianqingii TaxID=2738837 RepID=UPI0011278D6A|nr:HI1506-related protein [Limnobaculum xujianqingii]